MAVRVASTPTCRTARHASGWTALGFLVLLLFHSVGIGIGIDIGIGIGIGIGVGVGIRSCLHDEPGIREMANFAFLLAVQDRTDACVLQFGHNLFVREELQVTGSDVAPQPAGDGPHLCAIGVSGVWGFGWPK